MDPITAHRKNHRRGNYSLLMGVASLVVVGFAAFAVDISLITMSQLQVQATADAASHAALIAFHENLNTGEGDIAVNFIRNVNPVGLGTADIDSIEYGQWDFAQHPGTFTNGLVRGNANAVRVRLSRQGTNAVDLLLAPILGVTTHDVRATSVTAQQQRAVMLIQDMSCSMMTGEANDTDSAINISRLATLEFLEFIDNRPQKGDMLGLATFAQVAGNPPAGPHPWGNRPNDPWLSLLLVEDNLPLITERINGICDTGVPGATDLGPPGPLGDNCLITGVPSPHVASFPFCGGGLCDFPAADIGTCTNPAPAIRQAIDQLDTAADEGYFRGIVLMSDGLPTCTAGSGQINAANAAAASADANNAANEAQSLGISIWTVVFHNGNFDPAFMGCDPTDADGDGVPDNRGLTRGIGFCQSSPDAADLPNMYRQVAESLPTAFVD
jgi:Flp pilus assembly protein TadG